MHRSSWLRDILAAAVKEHCGIWRVLVMSADSEVHDEDMSPITPTTPSWISDTVEKTACVIASWPSTSFGYESFSMSVMYAPGMMRWLFISRAARRIADVPLWCIIWIHHGDVVSYADFVKTSLRIPQCQFSCPRIPLLMKRQQNADLKLNPGWIYDTRWNICCTILSDDRNIWIELSKLGRIIVVRHMLLVYSCRCWGACLGLLDAAGIIRQRHSIITARQIEVKEKGKEGGGWGVRVCVWDFGKWKSESTHAKKGRKEEEGRRSDCCGQLSVKWNTERRNYRGKREGIPELVTRTNVGITEVTTSMYAPRFHIFFYACIYTHQD